MQATKTLPKPSKVQREVGYDPSPPRCAICIYQRVAMVQLPASPKTRKQSYCGKHHFNTQPEALCDAWVGFDRTELEQPKPPEPPRPAP